MARPVGDEHIARPEAANAGQGCEPDPATPADLANRAVNPWVPHRTNWIVGSIEVHVGDRIRLADGREGNIVRTSRDWCGWPVVRFPTGDEAVRPSDIVRLV